MVIYPTGGSCSDFGSGEHIKLSHSAYIGDGQSFSGASGNGTSTADGGCLFYLSGDSTSLSVGSPYYLIVGFNNDLNYAESHDLYGRSSGTALNSIVSPNFTTLTNNVSGVGTIAFYLSTEYEDPTLPPYSDTHINSLSPNAVSTTSPLTTIFSFYQGTTTPASRVNISLVDSRFPSSYWVNSDIPLSFSQAANHTYSAQLRAYPAASWNLTLSLFDAFDNLIEATTTNFSIASDSTGYNDYDPASGVSTTSPGGFYYNIPGIIGSSFATSTLDSDFSLLGFLNIPQLLKTKIPFAYIYQISSTVRSSISSTSADTIPTGSFSWTLPIYGRASSTISIDLFSTTTITYFLTPTWVSILRGLMVAVTYFSLGWFIFHEAKHRKLLR